MILATSNLHKVGEMRDLLPGVDLQPLPHGYESPVEDGDTFEANALIKARAAHAALGGAGARRRLGDRILRPRRRARDLLGALRRARGRATRRTSTSCCAKSTPSGGERRAAYVCVLALIDADGTEHVFEANCEGVLLRERRGGGGFGYDPIFVPDDTDDDRTMSELSADEKNAISHRGRAARLLAAHLAL